MASNLSHQRRSQGVYLQESGVGSSINLAMDHEASATSTPVAGRPSTSTLYSQFQSTESENRSVPAVLHSAATPRLGASNWEGTTSNADGGLTYLIVHTAGWSTAETTYVCNTRVSIVIFCLLSRQEF